MKIVVTSGYFDPIHRGHIECLKLSKELANKIGAKLIVILNNDKQVSLKKGKPFMPLEDRKAVLESIKFVDEVFVSIDEERSVCKSIEEIRPNIFTKGGDRFSTEVPEAEVCKRLGVRIVDRLGEKIQSSSDLIKKFYDKKREEVA